MALPRQCSNCPWRDPEHLEWLAGSFIIELARSGFIFTCYGSNRSCVGPQESGLLPQTEKEEPCQTKTEG